MTGLLLTGVTGFLGRYIAVRLLDQRPSVVLWVLVRAEDDAHAWERIDQTLERAGCKLDDHPGWRKRIVPVVGDITLPNMGLDPGLRERLVSSCRAVVHAAANVKFNQSLEDARMRNVQGTRVAVELAREIHGAGRLKRFDWVGTAFVAGLRRDRVSEDELEHDAGWKNPYEQSKYEAEVWLRTHAADLPLTVFRPSIIVGHSQTGSTTNFGMLYWPLRVYAEGWWRTIVGRPDTTVDIVPVDFVAEAIEALSREGVAPGGSYHLAAGPDGAPTIAQLAEQTRAFFDGKEVRYIAPKTFLRWVRPIVDMFIWGKKRKVLRSSGRFFIPYFDGNPVFDVSRSHGALAAFGIAPPRVDEYLAVLLEYCRTTDFGRRPPEGTR